MNGLKQGYDDMGPKIKLIGNYEDMLSYKSESVKTKGALYFYSEEEKSQDLKQAESILDALKQEEQIMQKKQIARSKSKKLAKDW